MKRKGPASAAGPASGRRRAGGGGNPPPGAPEDYGRFIWHEVGVLAT
jgi:hypothetical protein